MKIYETFFTLVAISFLPSCFLFVLISLIVIPYKLNSIFDPMTGLAVGKKRNFGTGKLFPYGFAFRSWEYAKAIIYPKFAIKEFGTKPDFFSARVSKKVIFLCHIHLAINYFTLGFAIPMTFALTLYEKFFR